MDDLFENDGRSDSMEPGAYHVTSHIERGTTVAEFNDILATVKDKDYKLRYGGRCGWNALGTAAHKGNLELVRHIIAIGDKELLNLGNGSRWTPLYCAAKCENEEQGYLVSKVLIEAGADVNICTTGDIPPLYISIHAMNVKLTKLLLEHKAVLPDYLDDDNNRRFIDGLSTEKVDAKATMKHWMVIYSVPGDVLVYSIPLREVIDGLDNLGNDLSFEDKMTKFTSNHCNQKYRCMPGSDGSLELMGGVEIVKIWTSVLDKASDKNDK